MTITAKMNWQER